MENKKLNWVLWVGLAIPIIVLLVVVIMTYAPNGYIPKYDFIYSYPGYNYDYCYPERTYKIVNQKIYLDKGSINKNNTDCSSVEPMDPPKIYYYDVLNDTVTSLTLTEAQKLKLDNNLVSPDGTIVQRGMNVNYGILELFGGNDYNSLYLKSSDGKFKKINWSNSYIYDFRFIGWVLK